MSQEHPSQADLERYVMDDLDDETTRGIEAHVSTCEECARALAGEARIEVELHAALVEKEIAPPIRALPKPISLRSRRQRQAIAIAAALAAVAAIVMLFHQSPQRTPSDLPTEHSRIAEIESPSMRITCDGTDDATERQCRERLRCRGQFIEDGAGLGDVPKYEHSLAECNRAPGLRASQKGSL